MARSPRSPPASTGSPGVIPEIDEESRQDISGGRVPDEDRPLLGGDEAPVPAIPGIDEGDGRRRASRKSRVGNEGGNLYRGSRCAAHAAGDVEAVRGRPGRGRRRHKE